MIRIGEGMKILTQSPMLRCASQGTHREPKDFPYLFLLRAGSPDSIAISLN